MRTLDDEIRGDGWDAVLDAMGCDARIVASRLDSLPEPPQERFRKAREEMRAMQIKLGFIDEAA